MSAADRLNRRDFLSGAFRGRNLALAAAGGLLWSHVVGEARATGHSIRPPGARPESDFVAACIKCGQCAGACPFDTLQVAMAGEGHAIGVPYFEPREIPCRMCEDVPCANACPTDALAKGMPIEEAEMGLAVLLDHETCLAYQGLRCEVCYRACPLLGKSISLEFRPQKRTGKHAFFIPVVSSEYCTGCGMCEHACVLEEAAIKVLPRELAQGKLGENYRFGWKEEPVISRDFEAPERAPDIPEFEGSLERVLEAIHDLSGIEEP